MSQAGRLKFASGSVIVMLEGDTGGPISPDASNTMYILGGVGVETVGDPLTNSITINFSGDLTLEYTNVNTSPYAATSTDEYLSVDSSGGAITVQLPNTASTGRTFIIKDRTGSAASNNITVTTPGGTVAIDGSTSFVMNTAYEAIEVIFNGTNYEVY